jgi:hypothetical protein
VVGIKVGMHGLIEWRGLEIVEGLDWKELEGKMGRGTILK